MARMTKAQTCAAVVATFGLASTAFAADNWSVYRQDQKAAEVFGRPVAVQKAGSVIPLADPTLGDIAAADTTLGANANVRGALDKVLGSPAAVSSCQSLTGLQLPWMRVTSAEMVGADKEAMAHCKVLAVIDKEINLEVILPNPDQWNGKFLMGGTGGFIGTLQNGMKASALHRGYASASTDTGHPIPKDVGASWALHNPERVVNWGHRGNHLAQANAKLVIQAYYKKAIAKAYYYGASGSGRVAMVQAQRYPDDFDGVIAACPAFSWTKGIALSMAWTQQAMYPTAEDQYAYKPNLPAEKVTALDAAVYGKCDAVDGLKDGIITNPRACNFDPHKDLPVCKDGQDNNKCFTPKQIDLIAKIHEGPSNSTGKIWQSWPYGGESISGGWATDAGSAYVIGTPWASEGVKKQPGEYSSRHYLLSNETLRYVVFGDPNYDLHKFNFETDMAATEAAAAQIDGDNADLTGLQKSNGKLLIYVGYADWAVNANSTEAYYERMLAATGPGAKDTARLFMVPGMGHCNSADPSKMTTNVADFLTSMEQWVEQGKAPERIIASHVLTKKGGQMAEGRPQNMPITGYVARTRPLCPYPAVATYTGKGSIDDAANFQCSAPQTQASR